MVFPNENDNHLEENNHSLPTIQPEAEHSEASQVLETMRHLIGEIQSFKDENEQMKKVKERQHEFNEILIQGLHEKNNGKYQQAEKDRVYGGDAEGDGVILRKFVKI